MIGTRLAHYEITGHLGAGGMGEVYQATDSRLGRIVAIKLLPEAFNHDNDRVARFEREARLLASLNHPNIAAIYGVEESGGRKLLVMELVPGETLAEKIHRGPIPVDETLEIAAQITEALEAAHEKGVVHRDLKPANIKVTSDGKVKVLDFGLAKAFAVDASERSLSNSPTLSIAATNAGMILGTAAYMSPEQAKGAEVDRRTDIFAFGSLLYEMLTGKQAFPGDTISEIMASVLKIEPDYMALPGTISHRLRALLQRCLQKDPKKRWRDVGDLRFELEQVGESPIGTASNAPGLRSARSRVLERVLWLSAILGTVVLTWWTASFLPTPRATGAGPTAVNVPVRFSISPPDGVSLFSGGWIVPFSLSPDGRWLAYTAASDDGRSRLWVRPMGSEVAQPIPGTEGAINPFWSPNSESVGFLALNVLYRVRIPGGAPETISRIKAYTSGISGAAWGDDVILFPGPNGTLFRVPVQGGQSSQLTNLDSSRKERVHLWPQFLTDGRHFLYVSTGEPGGIYVDSIAGGQRSLVMEMPSGISTIRYVPGYLFYVENMVLWAHPFDETSLHLTGERRRIAGGVPTGGPGAAPFSVSNTGVLAYWTQSLIQQAGQLQWIDRKGNRQGLVGSPVVYDGFDLSRNGARLVSAQVTTGGTDIWVQDLVGGGDGTYPLRFDPKSTVPVWSPDGKHVAFLLAGSLYLADADRTANSPIRLTDPSRNQLAQSWTASGDQLLYEDWNPENGIDLAVVELKGRRVTRLDLNTSSNEFGGRLTPDDRWLAYVTDQTGRPEVWVAAFPSGQPRRRVSLAGGSHPDWNGKGTELYYITSEGQLVAVSFSSHDSSIEVGAPTNLFHIPRTIDISAGSHNIYKAGNDGQRFLVAVNPEVTKVPPIRLIMNWPQLLSER